MSWWIMPTHRLLPAVFVSQGLAAVARVQKMNAGVEGRCSMLRWEDKKNKGRK
jgi:hypothetical protein